MSDDKPTDAEEIFSEYQKEKMENEKPAETPVEPDSPSESTPEPTPESTPEPTPESTPEPTTESTPEPTPESTPEPTTESTPEPTPESTPEPTPESTPEPTPESTKTQESQIETSETNDDNKERIRDVIFVGTKPIMVYVTATLTQLSNQNTVTIKARGKRITQAVDVSQMIVKRMDSVGYVISDVRIASDSLTSQDGRQRNVSTIEIDVTKP